MAGQEKMLFTALYNPNFVSVRCECECAQECGCSVANPIAWRDGSAVTVEQLLMPEMTKALVTKE